MHTENVSSFHSFRLFYCIFLFCNFFLYISIFAECNQSFVKNEMEQIEERNETISRHR